MRIGEAEEEFLELPSGEEVGHETHCIVVHRPHILIRWSRATRAKNTIIGLIPFPSTCLGVCPAIISTPTDVSTLTEINGCLAPNGKYLALNVLHRLWPDLNTKYVGVFEVCTEIQK